MRKFHTPNDRRILVFGIIPICLLTIAILITWIHLPNGLLFIAAGFLLFNFVELPIFLIWQNRTGRKKIFRHYLFLVSAILFNLGFFFALQQEFVPIIGSVLVILLAGTYVVWYFAAEIKSGRQRIRKFTFLHIYIIFLGLMAANVPIELQAPDYRFKPPLVSPAYTKGSGPVILFDQAHNNIHTLDHRLIITSALLGNDGYNVQPLNLTIETGQELEGCDILVIVNPLNRKNVHNWRNPTFSAFSDSEIRNINQWVLNGGSLLLIVDHMPIPGAAYNLAKSFGVELKNGHTKQIPWNDNWFVRGESSLPGNPITDGRSNSERVDSILVFGGSAFPNPADAEPILILDSAYYQWEPDVVWDFRPEDRYSAEGFVIGIYKEYGMGKLVVFSEAMMFTAQLGGGLSWIKLGMNSNKGPDNYQLLLNTIHWLDGLMDP